MNTTSSSDKYDAATLALDHIRTLALMHRKYDLDPEELALICHLIYDIAEMSILPEA